MLSRSRKASASSALAKGIQGDPRAADSGFGRTLSVTSAIDAEASRASR